MSDSGASNAQSLLKALVKLEALMRTHALWSTIQPSSEAMASQEPFACDQMSFPEWLQYLFIPRLMALIEQPFAFSSSLGPHNSDVASMAEYYFQQRGLEVDEIVMTIREIDQLLTEI